MRALNSSTMSRGIFIGMLAVAITLILSSVDEVENQVYFGDYYGGDPSSSILHKKKRKIATPDVGVAIKGPVSGTD